MQEFQWTRGPRVGVWGNRTRHSHSSPSSWGENLGAPGCIFLRDEFASDTSAKKHVGRTEVFAP